MSLEEARILAATLARQLELSAMSGKWMMLNPESKGFEVEAKYFSEAIRIILRHAADGNI